LIEEVWTDKDYLKSFEIAQTSSPFLASNAEYFHSDHLFWGLTPRRLLIEAKTNGTPLQRTNYPQANTPTTPVDVISYGGIDKVCWLLLIEGYLIYGVRK